MDLEQRILKLVSSKNSYIHDDCAYLSKSEQLISTDTLVESVHFNLKHFDASKIAHRLFVCNYSDIQSSGGYPEYALLNISFPNKSFKITQQIIKFFKKLLTKHNIKLIGGDTTSSSKIYLSSTFISEPIKKSEIINRKNANVGDSIYTFKNIGFSKLGYLSIFKKQNLNKNLLRKSKDQFLKPKIITYSNLFNKYKINSCMDISDSLYSSLNELSKQSKKKFLIDNLKEISPLLLKNLNYKNYFSLVLSSGEEFVPVFTGKLTKQDIKFFKLNRIHIIKIGSVQKGQGVTFTELENFKNNTFSHFKKTYSN
ncbi:MAG: thiamine-phosphate kinase [Alphaproteobacteria bacterium]